MLVSELRALLKNYKEEELRLIIAEMYKLMPKKFREENRIDTLLKEISTYMQSPKGKEKSNKVNIYALKDEIELFIDNAYKQYYLAPNNVIHKKDRSKWRFKVKAYIKDLQGVTGQEEASIASDLLQKIYKMLCYGCAYYIFNTDNPFRSVGIAQTWLLDEVIKRSFSQGINKSAVKSAIELTIDNTPDRDTLHSSLMCVLIANLKTPDAKEIAIEQCIQLLNELENYKKNIKNKSWSFKNDFDYREKFNNITEMVFRIYIELCEFDKAVNFFYKNYEETNKEIELYVLLRMISEYKLKELWLREYENALKKKIKPREGLTETYNYIKDNGKIPEYFHINYISNLF